MNLNKILLTIIMFFMINQNLFSIDLDQLVLEPGFKVSIFAKNLNSPRQMAEGKNGTIFVGERDGQIIALIDTDNNGQADFKRVIANNLTYSTGISLFEGDIYFSEVSKIWKILNIESSYLGSQCIYFFFFDFIISEKDELSSSTRSV